jgi:hypothetical protein
MTERISLTLWSPQQAHQEIQRVWAWVKSMLMAGHRLVLEVRQETRSDAQNRLLHSRIGDVARQCEWAGRKWEIDEWKRLLAAAWLRTRNEGVQMVPALDGHGFDVLYQRTSKLTRAECAELSEYIMAWGSERGVQWCAASLGRDGVDPETGEILDRA